MPSHKWRPPIKGPPRGPDTRARPAFGTVATRPPIRFPGLIRHPYRVEPYSGFGEHAKKWTFGPTRRIPTADLLRLRPGEGAPAEPLFPEGSLPSIPMPQREPLNRKRKRAPSDLGEEHRYPVPGEWPCQEEDGESEASAAGAESRRFVRVRADGNVYLRARNEEQHERQNSVCNAAWRYAGAPALAAGYGAVALASRLRREPRLVAESVVAATGQTFRVVVRHGVRVPGSVKRRCRESLSELRSPAARFLRRLRLPRLLPLRLPPFLLHGDREPEVVAIPPPPSLAATSATPNAPERAVTPVSNGVREVVQPLSPPSRQLQAELEEHVAATFTPPEVKTELTTGSLRQHRTETFFSVDYTPAGEFERWQDEQVAVLATCGFDTIPSLPPSSPSAIMEPRSVSDLLRLQPQPAPNTPARNRAFVVPGSGSSTPESLQALVASRRRLRSSKSQLPPSGLRHEQHGQVKRRRTGTASTSTGAEKHVVGAFPKGSSEDGQQSAGLHTASRRILADEGNQSSRLSSFFRSVRRVTGSAFVSLSESPREQRAAEPIVAVAAARDGSTSPEAHGEHAGPSPHVAVSAFQRRMTLRHRHSSSTHATINTAGADEAGPSSPRRPFRSDRATDEEGLPGSRRQSRGTGMDLHTDAPVNPPSLPRTPTAQDEAATDEEGLSVSRRRRSSGAKIDLRIDAAAVHSLPSSPSEAGAKPEGRRQQVTRASPENTPGSTRHVNHRVGGSTSDTSKPITSHKPSASENGNSDIMDMGSAVRKLFATPSKLAASENGNSNAMHLDPNAGVITNPLTSPRRVASENGNSDAMETAMEYVEQDVEAGRLAEQVYSEVVDNPETKALEEQLDSLTVSSTHAATRRSTRIKDQHTRKVQAHQRKLIEKSETEASLRSLSEELTQLSDASRAVLPPLSKKWTDKLNTKMDQARARDTELAKSLTGTELNRHAFGTCVPRSRNDDSSGWLNDEIIFAYIEHVVNYAKGLTKNNPRPKAARDAAPRYAVFNTQFWSTLAASGPEKVARWASRIGLKGDRLLQADLVFIPINSSYHWTLLALYPRQRRAVYYDSMGNRGANREETLRGYLKVHLKELYKEDEWTFEVADSPQQNNGSDCGAFAITTARMLALGWNPKQAYSAADINMQRRRILCEIMNSGLHGDFQPADAHAEILKNIEQQTEKLRQIEEELRNEAE